MPNNCHIVEGNNLELGGVEWEDEMEWFVEAMHMALATVSDDQPNIEDVINGEESEKWMARMEEELTQIERLETWQLVESPPNGLSIKIAMLKAKLPIIEPTYSV